ncbi:MAG TPA: ferrous iron transport protein B [bacterium]|nr:ferrous iron transport protein B [bacterium]
MKNSSSAPCLRLVLIGQPNCGKSTLFNQVAGYRSISTNFAGATVSFTSSLVQIGDQTIELIDLPGLYSLTAIDPATEAAKQFLLFEKIDLVVNVVDASLLCRSLELTLQMAELGLPMVLCLNMIDEAQRKGVEIDGERLSSLLCAPVFSTIASKGIGVETLFTRSVKYARSISPMHPITMSKHVETAIRSVVDWMKQCGLDFDKPRLLAIKLLEHDPYYLDLAEKRLPGAVEKIKVYQQMLEEAHGQPSDQVISAERHAKSMELFEEVARVGSRSSSLWRDRIDDLLMHPIVGYVIMLAVLYLLFVSVFKLGAFLETPILAFFQSLSDQMALHWSVDSFTYHLLNSLLQGFSGGVSIVLPYLFPFLLLMALIEDIGYLPRMAFLTDGIMHRLGLHGTAIIPLLLGYGCTVPAVMATRIITRPRDRFIASTLALFVPCSARMTLILGLVGFYLGGAYAFWLLLLNIVIILGIGLVLSRLSPEETPGMIMEIPAFQAPGVKVVLAKTWLRIKDFIVIAWPLLILGSLFLSITEWLHWQEGINRMFSPLTRLLDLPEKVGLTIIFGVLRKELSMLMLFQSLGTTEVLTVMTPVQIMVFTVFILFYLPCLATFGIMVRELGMRKTLLASALSLFLAIWLAWLTRFIAPLFL